MLRIGSTPRLVLIALVLGLVANLLFYNKPLGISGFIFTLLLLIGLLSLGWLEKVKIMYRNLWLVIPLLFFSIMLFIRANTLLTFLNVLAVLTLFGFLLFFYAAGQIERLNFLDYLVVLTITGIGTLFRPVIIVSQATSFAMVQKKNLGLAVKLARGIFIAIPVLLVFTVLLASADTVFARYVDDFSRLKTFQNFPNLMAQLSLILLVSWLTSGAFLFSLNRTQGMEQGNAATALPGLVPINRRLGFVEGATVLMLVDLLFIAFAWIQFTYLFSGQAASNMNYQIYRDYVRRGFGELLFAAFLTMVLILGMRWITRTSTQREQIGFNVLSTLMIGLAGVMLVSSFQRMLTWESVTYYINTDTRLYVRSFMLWLGISFLWLAFTLWVKPERFAIGILVAAIGFLATVNVLNPDADVAEYNIARYANTQDSDLATRYLYRLSDDAIPALVASLDQTQGVVQERIRLNLSNRLHGMEVIQDWRDWPAFHLARTRAYDLLLKLRKDGRIS